MQARLIGLAALLLLASCTSNADPDPVATGSGCRQELVVYLHASASPARQAQVGRLLDDHEDVETTTFHSPEDAYKEFKRTYRGQPEIYKDRSPGDFPGSYEVTLIPGAEYGGFEASLVGTPGIDKLVPGPCSEDDG